MNPTGTIQSSSTYVLGVDLARLGSDSTVFIIIEQLHGTDELYVVYVHERQHTLLTDAIHHIKRLDEKFHFRKIICDCTGLGAGVVDVLREEIGFIVEGIVFTLQSKEDLYVNLKAQMQRKRIKIPEHKKLIHQLSDLRYEFTKDGKHVKIHHSERGHDDYTDALALAASYFSGKMRIDYRMV